jgi:exosome complex protein LRP1
LRLTISPASLRIDGSDAQNHAVYGELKRIQQYFAKIKAAEEPVGQRSTTVNQEAAARILKNDLVSTPITLQSGLRTRHTDMWQSDNKALSSKLAEKIAEERAKALLKSFEGGSSGKKRAAEDGNASAVASGDGKKSSKKQKGKGKSKR